MVIAKRAEMRMRNSPPSKVSGKLLIPRERQQTMRVTESKCLRRRPKGVRSARKGIEGPLPGVESRSSEARVSDGRLKPDSEDSLHYGLLFGVPQFARTVRVLKSARPTGTRTRPA